MPENHSECKVTYNSDDQSGVFKVHVKDGILECLPHPKKHYLCLSESDSVWVVLVNMFQGNYEEFTKKGIKHAHTATKLQEMVWHQSQCDFKGWLMKSLLSVSQLLSMMLKVLTKSLVPILQVWMERQSGRCQSVFKLTIYKSPRILCNWTNMLYWWKACAF